VTLNGALSSQSQSFEIVSDDRFRFELDHYPLILKYTHSIWHYPAKNLGLTSRAPRDKST
jgi:hypothetical protein